MKKKNLKKLIMTITASVLFIALMQISGGGWALMIAKLVLVGFLFYMLISASGEGDE